jgi:hypothetical protein
MLIFNANWRQLAPMGWISKNIWFILLIPPIPYKSLHEQTAHKDYILKTVIKRQW